MSKETNEQRIKNIIQCQIAEYNALRSEIGLQLISMRRMVILNYAASAAIASFALANIDKNILLLLIIPLLSSSIGIIMDCHYRRISQL